MLFKIDGVYKQWVYGNAEDSLGEAAIMKSPSRRLMTAMIEAALKDLHDPNHWAATMRWLLLPDNDHPLHFVSICEELGLRPKKVRSQISESHLGSEDTLLERDFSKNKEKKSRVARYCKVYQSIYQGAGE